MEPLEPRRLFAVSLDSSLAGLVAITPVALTIPDSSSTDLSTLSVVATDPADGSVVNVSPTVLNITFNQPIDPLSLGLFDIGLQRVDTDGTVIEDETSLLSEPFDLGDSPDNLPVTINGTLGPGQYQIVLLGSMSMLSGIGQDGNPGAPLAGAGTDVTVATFTIAEPGPTGPVPETLGNAVDLGTIGPAGAQAQGTLDLQANVGAYHLYKFTLAPGHYWRLGAEVAAQRDGGTLNSALALFDANGHLLKTDDVGRNDAPYDPFLFDGLLPGTYYLGVSDSGDLPDLAGGYDPVAGQFGTVGVSQDGGAYGLQVIAQVADAPTQLQRVQLQYADPLDPRPTGLTLVFSGPMDIDSFVNSSTGSGTFQGLQVVDDKGMLWPLTPIAYQESNSQFTFLFSQPLPKGHYSLVVPATGGVTDLAGLSPVAAGKDKPDPHHPVLAKWEVQHAYPPSIPNNLGTILNSGATSSPLTNTTILPGTTITYRFVAPAQGIYDLQALVTGGSLTLRAIGSEGQVTQQTGSSDAVTTGSMQLNCGTYYLQLTATGSAPVAASFSIYRQAVSAEAVFDNGVGQGPALNLTLISPTTLAPPDAYAWYSNVAPGPAPWSGGASSPDSAPPPAHPTPGSGATVAATTIESSSGTADLVLTLGSSLVGSPLAGAEHVAAVGPGTQTGVTALAANTPGVLQGITYGQTFGPSPSYTGSWSSGPTDVGAVAGEPPAYVDGALTLREHAPEPNMDENALAAASNWLGGLGAAVIHWLGVSRSTPSEPVSTEPETGPAERILLTRDDLVRPRRDDVEHADLTTPLGLSVISVLALRLRRPVGRWANRGTDRRGRRTSSPATGRAPHTRI